MSESVGDERSLDSLKCSHRRTRICACASGWRNAGDHEVRLTVARKLQLLNQADVVPKLRRKQDTFRQETAMLLCDELNGIRVEEWTLVGKEDDRTPFELRGIVVDEVLDFSIQPRPRFQVTD